MPTSKPTHPCCPPRSNYKKLCGSSRSLTHCVHELYHRGLIMLYSQTVPKSTAYYFSALPART